MPVMGFVGEGGTMPLLCSFKMRERRFTLGVILDDTRFAGVFYFNLGFPKKGARMCFLSGPFFV